MEVFVEWTKGIVKMKSGKVINAQASQLGEILTEAPISPLPRKGGHEVPGVGQHAQRNPRLCGGPPWMRRGLGASGATAKLVQYRR